ncbi:uncharacterized protein LOC117173087 [Belonocnema kinseyi]|uniref:uncharacterized protein LOC117173087 n=1 Tax=Belonocnema kinseyi TaxID=2817044 RepID=UPI00143D8574|nr:uncharacterized protein LOC117173087 [Belonocnema kinseyi]
MKAVYNLLFTLVVIFESIVGASCFQITRRDIVEVKMEDNSSYRGSIDPMAFGMARTWLNPSRTANITSYHVYVRLFTNHQYKSELIPVNVLSGHDPRQHRPTYAELRYIDDEYYTASDFQLYHYDPQELPPICRIYVIMPGGSVYSSSLDSPLI